MTEDYDPLAEEEAEAAAAEARNIGGRPTRDLEEDLPHDPAMDPVYEAGGGEQDGWEMAEEELIEHSEQGPAREETQVHVREEQYVEESPPSRSQYGEADEEDVTEVLEDPEEGPDDPERGTPLAPDR